MSCEKCRNCECHKRPVLTIKKIQEIITRIEKVFWRRDEEEQGLVEYCLIVGLITVMAIVALNAVPHSIDVVLQRMANGLDISPR